MTRVQPSARSPRLPDAVLRPAVGNVFETTVEQLATAIRLGVFVAGEQLPPEREQFLPFAQEVSTCAVDRPPFERIALVAREQVHVEVRKRVPVDLVVHLAGTETTVERLRHRHGVTPERDRLVLVELERFLDVLLGDHADVPG